MSVVGVPKELGLVWVSFLGRQGPSTKQQPLEVIRVARDAHYASRQHGDRTEDAEEGDLSETARLPEGFRG